MTRRILWAAVISLTVLVGLLPVRQAGADINGSFPLPAKGGLAILVYTTGGSVDQLRGEVFNKGCGLVSVWTTKEGRFVGYAVGAPSFVNAEFLQVYPEGQIPAGSPLLVVCQEGGIGGPKVSVPPGCLPWPQEIVGMLVVLSVPDGLCLMEKQGTMPSGVGYVYPSRTVEYWFPDSLPRYPLYVKPSESAIVRGIAEQVCVAHQHQVVMDSGLEFDYQEAWSRTLEGIDFMKTTGWTFQGDAWYQDGVAQEYLRPTVPARQACASWYLGYPMTPEDRSWATKWLPPQK
ncbi:MAG: hypothetical protein Q8Q38_00955 [bacterium]|nr:hypothetical protein [bacterium]